MSQRQQQDTTTGLKQVSSAGFGTAHSLRLQGEAVKENLAICKHLPLQTKIFSVFRHANHCWKLRLMKTVTAMHCP